MQAARVAGDRPGLRVEHALQPHALRLRRRSHGFHRRFDERLRENRLHVQTQLTRGDSTHVQQVLDQLRLHARVALNGLQSLAQLIGGGLAGTQQMRPAQDRT
jgi:hypothetical protein